MLGDEVEDVLAMIDQALLATTESVPPAGDHDLIEGLSGIGVYFLKRGDAESARAGLARVVEQLDQTTQPVDGGVSWLTPPARLPAREAAWGDHRDCGVAHGVPGVIAFLACAAATRDAPPRARPLCEAAIRWLLAQRSAGGFPTRVRPCDKPGERTATDHVADGSSRHDGEGARAAWCHGDPGVAAALTNAAAHLGSGETVARDLALTAARRDPATSGVNTPHLCHRAAGLAHLFNRMFQASGDAALGVGLALPAAATTTEP